MIPRGFGIDATTPVDVVVEVAREAERAGYSSFWLNGSPPRGALEGLAAAAEVTTIPLGVGVLPLHRRSIEEVVADVKELAIPTERFLMGIGYSAPRGALDMVRRSVDLIHGELGARAVVGPFGPNMTRLGGEIGDGVLFTWWFVPEIERSRPHVEEGAERVGCEPPPVYSYIRCAPLPSAEERLEEEAGRYDSSPRFREMFRRHGLTARDTVVTGATPEELQVGIFREEAVLDHSIIRAITAERDREHLFALLHACEPGR